MIEYEIISHTADVRILIRGNTIGELFKAGLNAINEILFSNDAQPSIKEKKLIKSIVINSPDQTSLLIDFLSNALTSMYIEKVAITNADIQIIGQQQLRGNLFGYDIDGFARDVKAVTYHEAEIIQKSDGSFETTIILDI